MAEKSHFRLLARLHGVPLLISEDKLRIITEAVTLPLLLGQADSIPRVAGQTNATKTEFASEMERNGRKLGMIAVFDSLVSKDVNAASGMTSYERINDQIDGAIARGFTDLGFYIDSPGGEATGLFGLTEKIRSLPSRGISTFAFVDNATSAAYAIAAATETLYTSETAVLGSIAALMVHSENTIQAEQKGITYTVLRSKELKAIGDPFTKLDDAAREKLTTMLASMDAAFNNDIAKSRPQLTIENIVDLKGASFMATETNAAKLADKMVPNLETALSDFFKTKKPVTKNKGVKMDELAQAQAQLAEAQTQIASLKAAHEVALTEVVTAERERSVKILNASKTLNVGLDSALNHIEKGYDAALSLEVMTEIAESKDSSKKIDTSTGSGATVHLDADPKAQNSASAVSFLKDAFSKAKGLKL